MVRNQLNQNKFNSIICNNKKVFAFNKVSIFKGFQNFIEKLCQHFLFGTKLLCDLLLLLLISIFLDFYCDFQIEI